jgi:hypothetical protein
MADLAFNEVAVSRRDGVLEIHYDPEYDVAVQQLLQRAYRRNGGYLRVELRFPKKPASRGKGGQINHIWGHCQDIADQLVEYSKKEVEEAMKRMAVEEGFPTHMTLDGIEEPDSVGSIGSDDAATLIAVIHRFSDMHHLWLTERDEQSGVIYRSIGGRTPAEMQEYLNR